jgi:hypothetical protein
MRHVELAKVQDVLRRAPEYLREAFERESLRGVSRSPASLISPPN